MVLCVTYLLLFLLAMTLSHPLSRPEGGCPTCEKQLPADAPTRALSAGEPCGVYTQSCGPGLRCEPPRDQTRSLHALLEGRGVCSNASSSTATTHIQTEDPEAPSADVDLLPTESPTEAPCGKQLIAVIQGLGAHRIQPGQAVYIPDCDKSGFFKRKQCLSSGGRQRGRCWCVDELGRPVPPKKKQKTRVSC